MMRSAFLDAKTHSPTLFLDGTAPLRMFAVLFANGAHCSRERKDLRGFSLFSRELTGTRICVPGKAKEELGKRLVG